MSDARRHWLVGRSGTMLTHLKNCVLQPAAVRERAKCDAKARKRNQAAAVTAATSSPEPGIPPEMFSGMPDPTDYTSISPFTMPTPSVQLTAGSSFQSNSPFNYSASASPIAGPSALPASNLFSLFPSMHGPSSAPIASNQLRTSMSRSASVISRRPSSSVSEGFYASGLDPHCWNDFRQRRFETRIARITASAGLPLGWIENPEVVTFISEFVNPAAHTPTRTSLTRRILPFAVKEAKDQTQRLIAALPLRLGTIQFDGWTGINSHHYDAFMLALARTVCVRYCHVLRELTPPPTPDLLGQGL